jgi:RimJ/RimL family protein N-acetyltransferase
MLVYDLKNGSKLSIRRAVEGDASEIVDMYSRMGAETDNLTFSVDDFYFNDEQERVFIGNLGSRANCLYLVAFVDNKIVANLSFVTSPRKKLEHRGNMGIAVLKDYWGIGIGTALMEYFLKWAQSTDKVKKIDLEVVEANTRAINLYLKYGFKIEGRISRGVYLRGRYMDIYYMGKTIG